jgi:hypothetical protein
MDFAAFIPLANFIIQLIGRIAERFGVDNADQATRAFAAVLSHSGASAKELMSFRNRLEELTGGDEIDEAGLSDLIDQLKDQSLTLDEQLRRNREAIEARMRELAGED